AAGSDSCALSLSVASAALDHSQTFVKRFYLGLLGSTCGITSFPTTRHPGSEHGLRGGAGPVPWRYAAYFNSFVDIQCVYSDSTNLPDVGSLPSFCLCDCFPLGDVIRHGRAPTRPARHPIGDTPRRQHTPSWQRRRLLSAPHLQVCPAKAPLPRRKARNRE